MHVDLIRTRISFCRLNFCGSYSTAKYAKRIPPTKNTHFTVRNDKAWEILLHAENIRQRVVIWGFHWSKTGILELHSEWTCFRPLDWHYKKESWDVCQAPSPVCLSSVYWLRCFVRHHPLCTSLLSTGCDCTSQYLPPLHTRSDQILWVLSPDCIFSHTPEKWVWSTTYSIFVQVHQNVGTLFFFNLTLDVIKDCIPHCMPMIYWRNGHWSGNPSCCV